MDAHLLEMNSPASLAGQAATVSRAVCEKSWVQHDFDIQSSFGFNATMAWFVLPHNAVSCIEIGKGLHAWEWGTQRSLLRSDLCVVQAAVRLVWRPHAGGTAATSSQALFNGWVFAKL